MIVTHKGKRIQITRMRALRLLPGDKIVLECEQKISPPAIESIKETVGKIFPNHTIVVFDGGLKFGVVREEGK